MAKYAKYDARARKEARYEIHPIWRGIGCFLMVLVPIMAWTTAVLVRQANATNGWIRLTSELNNYPDMSKVERVLPVLAPVWAFIERLYVFDLLLFVIFTVVGFGLLSIIYSMMYRFAGPPRYGPFDAPEIKGRNKVKKAR